MPRAQERHKFILSSCYYTRKKIPVEILAVEQKELLFEQLFAVVSEFVIVESSFAYASAIAVDCQFVESMWKLQSVAEQLEIGKHLQGALFDFAAAPISENI